MKKHLLSILIVCFHINLSAQKNNSLLSLTECYVLAKENYPLSKKRDLLTKSSNFTIENISKGYWPRLDLSGQATYQSEVTKIPVNVPGINIPELNKDQYKVYGEINQLLYDGGILKQQKDKVKTQLKVQNQQLEVELYQVKQRVTDLYFSVLIFNEQLRQNELLKNDIRIGIKTVEAQLENGTAYRSSADLLKAEYLKAEQQAINIRNYKKASLEMLGYFINREIDSKTTLKIPAPLSTNVKAINRPELDVFTFRKESLELDKKTILAGNRPKFNFFLQGGIGNPALNFLKDAFEPYYISGLRLSWSLTSFYTSKKQQQIVEIKKKELEADQETFLFNTNLSIKQQDAEIAKLEEYLATDTEIITLRNNVKKAALAQLKNGVISPADYLREVNEENQAIQNKILHTTELLLAKYKQKLITGN